MDGCTSRARPHASGKQKSRDSSGGKEYRELISDWTTFYRKIAILLSEPKHVPKTEKSASWSWLTGRCAVNLNTCIFQDMSWCFKKEIYETGSAKQDVMGITLQIQRSTSVWPEIILLSFGCMFTIFLVSQRRMTRRKQQCNAVVFSEQLYYLLQQLTAGRWNVSAICLLAALRWQIG